jgi:hypothetical protein
LEAGGKLDLALEPIGPERGGDFGEQHLQGHRPVVLEVLRQIDRGHALAAGAASEMGSACVPELCYNSGQP